MPTTFLKNCLYQAALPFLSPSGFADTEYAVSGKLTDVPEKYRSILKRHHVLGSECYLSANGQPIRFFQRIPSIGHLADADTMYRVASITKMATSLVTLSLIDDGLFTLDTDITELLPQGPGLDKLRGITVCHLLSHTSGLQDLPAVADALNRHAVFHDLLNIPALRVFRPGQRFLYCNFGYGLLGSVIENKTDLDLESVFQKRLFVPLGMRATLDGSTLVTAPSKVPGSSPTGCPVMPISRVLPYHAGQDVTIPPLGRIPLSPADPARHYGHTAGSMYTDTTSLSTMMHFIMEAPAHGPVSSASVQKMKEKQALYGRRSGGMTYGLGLIRFEDPALFNGVLYGHQGYAFGCADSAWIREDDGSCQIFLNGGCSEARKDHLGLCARDLIRWYFGSRKGSFIWPQ